MYTLPPIVTQAEPRQAPHNIECEQALLGAILVNNDALHRASDIIDAAQFFDPLHGRIYDVLSQEITAGRRVTPYTLKPFFEHEDPIGQVSVLQYLGRLMTHATSVINARDYALTIRDAFVRRELILIGEALVNAGFVNAAFEVTKADIALAEASLLEVGRAALSTQQDFLAAGAVAGALEMISKAYERDGGLAGMPTGYPELDTQLGGLAPSDLIILAGRPSMGKSALASNISINVARALAKEGAGEVSFYSLEMSAEQVMMREISRASGIAAERLRRGNLNEDGTASAEPRREFSEKIVPAGRQLSEIRLHIDATGGLKIGEFAARARRRKRLSDTRLIVIDYLQLMSSGRSQNNRQAEVSEITAAIKALAKELNVPIIALSQLSRQVESRENKRPGLADLRESGAIEQDADIVMFVYREEYYLQRGEPPLANHQEHQAWRDAVEASRGVAEVIFGKHRHGPIGTVKLQFTAPTTAFHNLGSGGGK